MFGSGAGQGRSGISHFVLVFDRETLGIESSAKRNIPLDLGTPLSLENLGTQPSPTDGVFFRLCMPSKENGERAQRGWIWRGGVALAVRASSAPATAPASTLPTRVNTTSTKAGLAPMAVLVAPTAGELSPGDGSCGPGHGRACPWRRRLWSLVVLAVGGLSPGGGDCGLGHGRAHPWQQRFWPWPWASSALTAALVASAGGPRRRRRRL